MTSVCIRNWIPKPPFVATCTCPYCTRQQQAQEGADDEQQR